MSATCAVEIQNLRAIDGVAVAAPFRARLQLRGFEARVRLGHRETGFFLAGRDRRQHAALLFLGAVNDDRIETEYIHVHGGSPGQPGARRGDSLHHDRGFADAETRPAVSLRDTHAEPAGIGERAIKFFGKFAVTVAREPIFVAKARADFFDGSAHRLLEL